MYLESFRLARAFILKQSSDLRKTDPRRYNWKQVAVRDRYFVKRSFKANFSDYQNKPSLDWALFKTTLIWNPCSLFVVYCCELSIYAGS